MLLDWWKRTHWKTWKWGLVAMPFPDGQWPQCVSQLSRRCSSEVETLVLGRLVTLTVGPVLHPDFMSKIVFWFSVCWLIYLSSVLSREGGCYLLAPPIEDSRIARLVEKLVSQELRKVKCIKLFSVLTPLRMWVTRLFVVLPQIPQNLLVIRLLEEQGVERGQKSPERGKMVQK